ncbi:MAG: NifU family protein [Proteobacteria bacterium]|nr:NifU family protein [Pseudomonadota bacterium]
MSFVDIRMQDTPNPRARKYILSQDIKAEGKVSYQDPAHCQHVPMAHALLLIEDIAQVHFFENVITLTQKKELDQQAMDQQVKEIIEETFPHHDPHFVERLDAPTLSREQLSEEIIEIEDILDATIRPSLQMDGGDVEVLEVSGDIISVRYLGACGGCPSAFEGTLQAMKYAISDGLGRNIDVVAV